MIPGALYLADRAYGKASQFAYIIDRQADFIFRFSPKGLKLFYDKDCKNKIHCEDLLIEKNISLNCYFKFESTVYPMRLVVAPIPTEKHESIEKRLHRKASKKQYLISDRFIQFSKWVFIATSISGSVADKDILDIYRSRWQIELFFKRAKSLLHFHKLRRSSSFYMNTVVLLWVAVVSFVSAVAFSLSLYFNFDISLFNLFSLSISLFS